MDYVILQRGKRDTDTASEKENKIERVSEKGRARERDKEKKRETGVVEVSLWMWSLKMLKCCVCCEHPSNGKSLMGSALRRSRGCYIKAEVLHQRFAGSRY